MTVHVQMGNQHIANWLHHGVCSVKQVKETLERMAVVVDRQNQGNPLYRNLSPQLDRNIAFQAASDLMAMPNYC